MSPRHDAGRPVGSVEVLREHSEIRATSAGGLSDHEAVVCERKAVTVNEKLFTAGTEYSCPSVAPQAKNVLLKWCRCHHRSSNLRSRCPRPQTQHHVLASSVSDTIWQETTASGETCSRVSQRLRGPSVAGESSSVSCPCNSCGKHNRAPAASQVLHASSKVNDAQSSPSPVVMAQTADVVSVSAPPGQLATTQT